MKLTIDELHRLSVLIEKINISKLNNKDSIDFLQLVPNTFIISFDNSLWACEGLKLKTLTPNVGNPPTLDLYKLKKNLEEKVTIQVEEIILYDFFKEIANLGIFNSNHYKFLSQNELPYFLNDFYEIIKDGSVFAEELKINLPTCLFNVMSLNNSITFPYLTLDKNTKYELISIISLDELKKLRF